MNAAQIRILNNTSADIRIFHDALIESIKAGELVEDLADLFTMEIIKDDNGNIKAILNWA